jgi:hypothetical protein
MNGAGGFERAPAATGAQAAHGHLMAVAYMTVSIVAGALLNLYLDHILLSMSSPKIDSPLAITRAKATMPISG